MAILSHLLFQVFLFLGLCIGGVFIAQNTTVFTLHFIDQTFENVPVWLALLGAFTLGLLTGFGIWLNSKITMSKK